MRLQPLQAPRLSYKVWPMRRYTTFPKIDLSFLIYTDRSLENWIVRKWDNDRRNMKLDQTKFIDMDLLSRDFAFNVAA